MNIIPVKIKKVKIESLSGQKGNAIKKIWESPAKLHAIAEIEEQKTNKFNTQYQLFCTIKKDNIISKNVKFIHGNEGCKNPCRMRQLTGQDETQVVFTFEVTEPGDYEVMIGNYLDIGVSTSFKIEDDFDE